LTHSWVPELAAACDAAENTRTARGAAAEALAPLTATVLSATPAAAATYARVIRLIWLCISKTPPRSPLHGRCSRPRPRSRRPRPPRRDPTGPCLAGQSCSPGSWCRHYAHSQERRVKEVSRQTITNGPRRHRSHAPTGVQSPRSLDDQHPRNRPPSPHLQGKRDLLRH
jgi:hypothetical protein